MTENEAKEETGNETEGRTEVLEDQVVTETLVAETLVTETPKVEGEQAQPTPAGAAPSTTQQPYPSQTTVNVPQVGQANTSGYSPNQNIQVGLLVWSAVLIIVGAILVIVPALGIPTFQGVVVSMFVLAGLAFLGLALYVAKNGSNKGTR